MVTKSKKNDTGKYILDLTITWNDLNKLWIETKVVKGFRAWIKYVMNYGKYAPMANFGARIINEYHNPYREIQPIYSEEKK
jgi:hypothetical protein